MIMSNIRRLIYVCLCLQIVINRSLRVVPDGWPSESSTRLPCWEIEQSKPHRFEPWSSQITDFKMLRCKTTTSKQTQLLNWCLSLPNLVLGIIRIGQGWLPQCQDNMFEATHHDSIYYMHICCDFTCQYHYQLLYVKRPLITSCCIAELML